LYLIILNITHKILPPNQVADVDILKFFQENMTFTCNKKFIFQHDTCLLCIYFNLFEFNYSI